MSGSSDVKMTNPVEHPDVIVMRQEMEELRKKMEEMSIHNITLQNQKVLKEAELEHLKNDKGKQRANMTKEEKEADNQMCLMDVLEKLSKQKDHKTGDKRLCGKPPIDFDEMETEIKNWLIMAEVFFSAFPESTEEDQIKSALSYFTGSAAKTFASQCYNDMYTGNTKGYHIDWDLFKDKCIALFNDKNAKMRADQAIQRLKIGSDIRAFINEYDLLAEKAGYDYFYKQKKIVEKIDFKIGQDIAMMYQPTTYDEWKKCIQNAYIHKEMYGQMCQWEAGRNHQQKQNGNWKPNQNKNVGSWNGNQQKKPFAMNWQQPQQRQDPNAMDIDKLRGGDGQSGRRMTCFKCGKVGHIARNCRSGGEQQVRRLWMPEYACNPFRQMQQRQEIDIRQMDAEVLEKIRCQILDAEIAAMAGKPEHECMEEDRKKMDFLMSHQ